MNGHQAQSQTQAHNQFKMPPRPTILRPVTTTVKPTATLGIPNGAPSMESMKAPLTHTNQRPPLITPPTQPNIKKPELKTPVVVHASAATPPPPQPPQQQPLLPPPSTPPGSAPIISTPLPTPVSQSQVIAQLLSDQVRVQLKSFESKIESKLETLIHDVVGATINDLKKQFEMSTIVGETLIDLLPVFPRPDPTMSMGHRLLTKGTKIKLYEPFISNVHGYWAMTSFVTNNGSVAYGYVPIFCGKLNGVDYGMSTSELQSRRDQWKGHLDQLSDKEFIPHIGKFENSV